MNFKVLACILCFYMVFTGFFERDCGVDAKRKLYEVTFGHEYDEFGERKWEDYQNL